MVINCIIVEDEPLALDKVSSFVAKVSYLNLVASFNSGIEVIGFLKDNKIDLIFLDVEMNQLSGFQLLESLTTKPYVIVISAFDKYTLRGYELSITDYLLKPFQFDRFLKAVEKVYAEITKSASNSMDFFFVRTEYRIEKILVKDVLCIEGMRDYRCIHLENGKVLTPQTFGELEKMLPDDKICRIHKSYMVALNRIEYIERSRIKMKDKLIPISDSYRDRFYSLIGVSDARNK